MKINIRGGDLVTPDTILKQHDLLVDRGKIAGIHPSRGAIAFTQSIDVRGMWVVPGFMDLHIHGSGGFDTMDATEEAIHGIAHFLVKHGVTSYLPTTVAAATESITAVVENIRKCAQPDQGAVHLGIHIEGPYLNDRYRGAQPAHHLRPADAGEYLNWLADRLPVTMITLAPEVEGAAAFIKEGIKCDVVFAVGHSEASYEQVVAAAGLGLSQATHLFNGMAPLHHRKPGVVGAVLTDDRVKPQVIADGIHLHPAILKLVVRAKGADRTILITDAVRATGQSDGNYCLGDQSITVKNGVARTAEGGLAGSTLTMDSAVKNIIGFAGVSLPEAITMATRTPADSIGLRGKKGLLAEGADADVAILDRELRVRMTMVAGRIVYHDL